jgi:hypothetical protein
MYKVYDTSQPAGFPIELDNFLAFQQSAYNTVLESIGRAFGNMVIIDGVIESGSPLVNVSPGFGIVNNEVVYFEGGAKQNTFYLTTDTATLTYQGGVQKPVLSTRIARFGTSPTLQFNYSDLKRVNVLTIMNNLAALTTAFNNAQYSYTGLSDLPPGYVSAVGTVAVGDVGALGANYIDSNNSLFTVNIADQGSTNYIIVGSMILNGVAYTNDEQVKWLIGTQSNNSFQLYVQQQSGIQNLVFKYAIIKLT